MKIGKRLAVVLLLTVIPLIAAHEYWSVQWTRRNYVGDLKRETRATMHGLAPILADFAQQQQWAQIRSLFDRMSADGAKSALLKADGSVWYGVPDFPRDLIDKAVQGGIHTTAFEFEQTVTNRYWFCRIVPLDSDRTIGYLLVAQDWTDIGESLRQRMLPRIVAVLLVLASMSALIPVLVNRYVSKPLAELSRKVLRFSSGADPAETRSDDELHLLSEEFLRLDQQLTQAQVDLLERHRRELELERRLQRADRLATIGTLASGLAHEIGTPMGIVRTRAELLLEGNPNPEKNRAGLEIIINQIERISGIVRMLLDYARGRELRRAEYDARTIVERVLKLVEAEAKRSGVRIVTELSNGPLTVECDPDQLQQVFVNLAVNAFDAMAPGGGTLTVTTTVEQKGHRSPILRVTFEDTGAGVPPEFQGRLFDPFFTTKPPGKGTGMGLSVSQSIMHDHNGEISFETESSGSRFYVTMPIVCGNAAAKAHTDVHVERST